MEVDQDAPAVARSEARIEADPVTVWQVLTAFEDWPGWNPDVQSVRVEGPPEQGMVFRWKAGRATITSTLAQLERPSRVAWTGTTTGIRAVHVWSLEPHDGGTFARTEESWDGLLVRILRGSMQKNLQKSLDDGLAYLKAEAERRAQASQG